MNEWQRFTRFIAVGGISSLANAVSRWILNQVVSYELAVALAYLVGMTVAFMLMRRFVFDQAWRAHAGASQALRFTIVNVGSLVQVWIISVGLARGVFPAVGFYWHPETIAHIAGLGSLTFTSYVAHKRFSFASGGSTAA
jgi:putative flippase GtrA